MDKIDLSIGGTDATKDRIYRHSIGTACRYTRYRRPVELIYVEQCGSYSELSYGNSGGVAERTKAPVLKD